MSLIIQIFQIMFPIVLIVGIGVFVCRRQQADLGQINEINLNVFVPALVFASLAQQEFSISHYATLAFCGLVLVLVTGLITIPFARFLKEPIRTVAPPMMFHNAGNVGLPLMSLALGKEGLAAGLILFLIGNLTHFGLGSYILDKNAKWLRSLTSPAILAAILAFALNTAEVIVPEFMMLPIAMLGNIAVPLMLFSLGARLAYANLQHWRLGLIIGLATPILGIILALIIISFASLDPIQTGVLLLFGALPPAVMNYLFAERYQQEPAKVSAIVLIGNVAAVATLPLALLYVLPRYG